MKKIALVYQAGIANVFEVKSFNVCFYGRDAKRLLQGSFVECEMFARGMAVAGCKVATFACNQAGDIKDAKWSEDLGDQPFNNHFRPVFNKVLQG